MTLFGIFVRNYQVLFMANKYFGLLCMYILYEYNFYKSELSICLFFIISQTVLSPIDKDFFSIYDHRSF